MVKEILNNIWEYVQHLYSAVHESVEQDFEKGGVKKMLQNKFVIVLAAALVLCIAAPMLSSSTVEVTFTREAEAEAIPKMTIKRIVLVDSTRNLKDPGEITINEIKIGKIESRQVDGQTAKLVHYEVDMKAKNLGKKRVAGSLILQKRGDVWYRYFEDTNAWLPA
ncbi:MAG: hypothetical protein AB1921_04315 [Thermodesulfobacteriota bacterium]